jgi:riboflavin biosynthesis pyrimidine reductase
VRAIDADEMRQLKARADKDLSVSGPTLASAFLASGLVDEISIYYVPVVVGSGTPMFKNVNEQLRLELLEERSFGNGLVFVRYQLHP